MLSVLNEKGMVELHPSQTDQRAIHVSLTKKCLDYFDSKEDDGNYLLNKLFSGISLTTLEQTAYLLNNLLQTANSLLDEQVD